MKDLSSNEQTKLFSEINQLINHKFVVTTTGITVFGVFAAFLIPKGEPVANSPSMPLLYAGTAFLSVFLGLLVYWAGTLEIAIDMLSEYLIQRQASEWEVDVKRLFESPIPHGSSYIWTVFAALGAATLAWPFVIEATIAPQNIGHPSWRHLLMTLCSVIYFVFLGFTAMVRTKKSREKMAAQWNSILSAKDSA